MLRSESMDATKIGVSVNPEKRCLDIRKDVSDARVHRFTVGMTRGVGYAAEAMSHGLLSEFRIRGEWFSASPDEAQPIIDRSIREAAQFYHGQKYVKYLEETGFWP